MNQIININVLSVALGKVHNSELQLHLVGYPFRKMIINTLNFMLYGIYIYIYIVEGLDGHGLL